jgi:response regulator RpfG family c-di-GMP phosphodiesterase
VGADRLASPLHDAGKVAIPDEVLLKPGKFTAEERALMETHAQLGYELLRGSASTVLELAASIAWSHHEKYDGADIRAVWLATQSRSKGGSWRWSTSSMP